MEESVSLEREQDPKQTVLKGTIVLPKHPFSPSTTRDVKLASSAKLALEKGQRQGITVHSPTTVLQVLEITTTQQSTTTIQTGPLMHRRDVLRDQALMEETQRLPFFNAL
jgi:hypothetical protein